MYRTHTCNDLSINDIGKKVLLSGWVNKRRDFGGVIFIDLRDFYGITQLVIEPQNHTVFSIAEKLRNEFVIKIHGDVVKRQESNVNKDLSTGEIEVKVKEIEMLNESKVPPFEISGQDHNVNEELRLKYRYLDLRRKKLQDNIVFRDKMIKYIHYYMNLLGYIEIPTPLLTVSSPEGSRDFLVPSRLHKGEFYALPQAPQQYKQLLMVGGIDKYYQIAPCFRDEDARSDRSPGEFYQLDVECSFKTVGQFMAEQEVLWIEMTEKLANKKNWKKPFPKITYNDAIDKYGSDKPDLRYDLEFQDITGFAHNCGFAVFNKAQVVKGICVPRGAKSLSRKDIDQDLTQVVVKKGARGLISVKVGQEGLVGNITKYFSNAEKEYLITTFMAKAGDLLLFVAGEYDMVVKSLAEVRVLTAKKLNLIDPNIIAWAWITDFPLYEFNEEKNSIEFMHNPFSMPKGGMEALSMTDPLKIISGQFDIIANGYEICSGAKRNDRPEILYKAFEIAGYSRVTVDKEFGHMIKALQLGAPPHCGYAPGIERLLMIFLGEDNIRNVIPFPKNSQAQDLMVGAPSKVKEEQLRDLGIKLMKEKEE
jgi:aspartyl-tRNA synthetase